MANTFGQRNSGNAGAKAVAAVRAQATPVDGAASQEGWRPLLRALFVLAFMLFIAIQTATGFVYETLGVRPKAMVVIDSLVNFLFVSRIGLTPSVIVLVGLGMLFAFLAYRRGSRTT